MVSRVLADAMGYRDAMWYIMTGDPFDGKTAEKIRLVNFSVPKTKLRAETVKLAKKLMSKSPNAVHYTKEAIRAVMRDMYPSLTWAGRIVPASLEMLPQPAATRSVAGDSGATPLRAAINAARPARTGLPVNCASVSVRPAAPLTARTQHVARAAVRGVSNPPPPEGCGGRIGYCPL